MDDDYQFEPQFHTESSLDEDGPSHIEYTGTFFPKAKHFVVAGGRFKSVTNIQQVTPSAPPDFPVIPLGHINLLQEIGHHRRAGVVHRGHGGNSIRRMYSAGIDGRNSNMTVALYQGDGAEDRWRQEVSRYSGLRHPYLPQLYGIARTADLQAIVFHDDLIPWTELEDKYRSSHSSTVFLWASIEREFGDLNKYISSLSGRKLEWTEYTVWIRSSTGHLCIDLTPPETQPVELGDVDGGPLSSGTSLLAPSFGSETMMSMSLREYHRICGWYLGRPQNWSVSPNVSMKLGSIRYSSGTEYESSLEVASYDCSIYDAGWATMDPIVEGNLHRINSGQEGTTIMENGWIRICSAHVMNEYCRRIHNPEDSGWLAQANDILNRLEITMGFEGFVLVDVIIYQLYLFGPTHNLPAGYLFLCPLAELQAEDPTCFQIPAQPAYWSLDPFGVKRLSKEAAEDLGFPAIHVEMYALACSWDASIYDGIRRFHESKGFDPYSQEVTIELGWPLLQVLCTREALFARKNYGACDDSDGDRYTEDGSESGDEQYDSASSELGDTFPLHAKNIDFMSHDALEDHTSEHDFIPTTNGCPSPVPEQSSPSSNRCILEEAELLAPSRSLNIVMSVQFVLILVATVLSMYEGFNPRS